MNTTEKTLRAFSRHLLLACAARTALRWMTLWCIAWGVVTMAARFSSFMPAQRLAWGLLGCVPVASAALWFEWRRRPSEAAIRAACDQHNHCGGLVIAGREAADAGWDRALPALAAPRVRWQGRSAKGFFSVALLFALLALLIPDRYAAMGRARPLDIGQTVEELQAQIDALQEEKILKDKKAEELKQELAKIADAATGADPAKTWEALDHLKSSNADLARQAAEEALGKTATLTQAETLAAATSKLPDTAAGRETATKAMQELSSLLESAKLDQGLLGLELPPGLLDAAKSSGLNSEQLKELMKQLQAGKGSLADAMKKLANLKMIDPSMCKKCDKAGQCPNPDGLAAYLSESKSGLENLQALLQAYCLANGGVSEDLPANTPMIFGDKSSEADAKFKEQPLPMNSLPSLTNAQRVGISKAAPEVTGATELAQSGALAGASAGGGEARVQTILPRHKAAVQRFFKREN